MLKTASAFQTNMYILCTDVTSYYLNLEIVTLDHNHNYWKD